MIVRGTEELFLAPEEIRVRPRTDPVFYFWSSTSLNSCPASAWYVGFQSGANGILGSTSKTQKHLVRAVRTATGR